MNPRSSKSTPRFVRVASRAVLVFVATVCAADAQQVFTPRDVARIQSVVSAVVSPDGNHIAYTLGKPRIPLQDDDGPAWVELHIVDAAGVSRPFVTGKVNIGAVAWTPDGNEIAYLAKRGDDKFTSLYVVPVDGGESRRLLEHDADAQGFAFSPSDNRVAVLAKTPWPKEQQAYRDQGFDQEIYEEDWLPTKVWVFDRDEAESAAGVAPRALDLPGSASFVQWSPTGSHLAVVHAPTPLVDDSYMFKRVSVVDAVTGKVMQHIHNPGKLGQVEWSPDGKHLAMNSAIDINDPQEGHLMIAAVPGDGSLRDLTPDIEGHVESFAWQDAETLMYVADRRQATPIESVALDGKKVERYSASDVVFSGLSVSGDGQTAAMLGQNGKHPAELFLLSASDSQPRKLTDHNPWLSERRFAEQEVVRWRARDGLELEGVLIYPLNFTSGHRYPLIMLVHGGPESHIANRWLTSYSYPGQVGAARGFAVFHPNYRGSTGRGVEFSKLGQADAAGKEFDDLVDGVDHLVNIGLVDKDRVGITGGSYGGYASAWGATYYSDRFAASVMFVGISDNVSKLGTTDIPEEMYLVHHRKRLWDDWDYFLDRSPLRHVQKNHTPTLILHGKQDPRVHPSQSLELFRHLKTLKQAPARLVLYEGEGHGNRKAAARLDYNLRLLRWMEQYLQGAGGAAPPRELDYRAALQSGE